MYLGNVCCVKTERAVGHGQKHRPAEVQARNHNFTWAVSGRCCTKICMAIISYHLVFLKPTIPVCNFSASCCHAKSGTPGTSVSRKSTWEELLYCAVMMAG